MPSNNFVNEGRGVKSSHEEESDNSMEIKDVRTLEHWGRVSSTSSSCFTILTTKPAILAIRMVS